MSLQENHKADIVVLNYNGMEYLKKCLVSLYENIEMPFSVIVVDNASTDGDYSFLQEYPNLSFIPLDRNYGFSYGVNVGIKACNSEFVVLLNNDTEVEKGWLEHLVSCISYNEKKFSVCSKMVQMKNKDLIDDAGDDYTLLGWAYQNGHGKPVDDYNKQRAVFSCCGGASIYRRAIFEEIGYFDEAFFAYMEDVDIGYRAKIHGYKNVYCPDAVVYHVGSASSGSRYNAFKVKLAARNNLYVPYKNMPLLQLAINLPFLVIGFFIKYLFFVAKGLGKEYRQGIAEGLKTLKEIKRTKFRWGHLWNYVKIEGLLIKNTFRYVFSKVF